MSPLTLEQELRRVEQHLQSATVPPVNSSMDYSMSPRRIQFVPSGQEKKAFIFQPGGPFGSLVKSFFPKGFRQGVATPKD